MKRGAALGMAILVISTFLLSRPKASSQVAASGETAVPKPHLVQIVTPDIDKAEAWYRENIGFEIRKRMEFPEAGLRIAFLELNGFVLELVQPKDSIAARDLKPDLTDRTLVEGVVKLSFETDDIKRDAARLKKNGVRMRMETTWSEGTKSWFDLFYDADGNLLQFVQKQTSPAGGGAYPRPRTIGVLVPDAEAAAG